MEHVERVMIFIELVKGCSNTACPSYKTLCARTDDQATQFMTKDTLSNIIDDVLSNQEKLESIGRVDIWAYGCGDTLLHPDLDDMAELLSLIPFKKTVAVDSNCWRDNSGWGNVLSPVVLFKEGAFGPATLIETAKKWTQNFSSPRFGFILKTLTPEILTLMRSIEPWWNYPFVKARSFHYVPLGAELSLNQLKEAVRPDIVIDSNINIENIGCTDKKAIRVMYRVDGTTRRCLVSGLTKGGLSNYLTGDLSDCAECFPHMGGEQILVYPQKVLRMQKARCVSDKG
jgi:hypothetical protein